MKRILVTMCLILIAASGLQGAVIPIADRFYFPIGNTSNAKPYRVSQRFMEDRPGMVYRPKNGGPLYYGHLGEDLACTIGTKVYPIATGKVVWISNTKGWGRVVILEHRLGEDRSGLPVKIYTLYGHLSRVYCKMGQILQGGHSKPLGLSGFIGTGPHLHYELKSKALPGVGYSRKNSSNKLTCKFMGIRHWNPRTYIRRLNGQFGIESIWPANGAKNLPESLTIKIKFSEKVDAIQIANRLKIVPTPATTSFTVFRAAKMPNVLEVRSLKFKPGKRYELTVIKGVKSESGKEIKSDYSSQFSTKAVVLPTVAKVEFYGLTSEIGAMARLEEEPYVSIYHTLVINIDLVPVDKASVLQLQWEYLGGEPMMLKENLAINSRNTLDGHYKSRRKIVIANSALGDRLGKWRMKLVRDGTVVATKRLIIFGGK